MRNTIAKCIAQKACENKDFFLITGDAGLGVWDEYQNLYASQYANPGINEALCVGMASGLALAGKKVVYYNIAPFVIMRPYEQVRNDICYQELPVILVGTGSGLTYMPSGMTHYSIEDIALCLTLPNLDIFSPCDPLEAKMCFEYAYVSNRPSYIRIPKAGEPTLHTDSIDDITRAQILHLGSKDLALVTHSSMASQVLEAGKQLGASVITLPFINTPNLQVQELLESFERVVVIEEHYRYGGLGTLLQERLSMPVQVIGLENEFIHFIGNQACARAHFGLDSVGIVEKIIHRPPPPVEINLESNATYELYSGFSDSSIPYFCILSKSKRESLIYAYSDPQKLPYSLESLCG